MPKTSDSSKKPTKKTSVKTPVKKTASKKAPAKKTVKRKSSRTSAKKTRKTRTGVWRFLPTAYFWWRLFFLCFVAAALMIAVLDVQVREKFDGKKWAIPARVYARPLEIYQGMLLTPAALQRELNGLGYAAIKQPYQAGQFAKQSSASGDRYRIYTRDFTFPDGREAAAPYSLVFNASGNTVAQLTGADDDLVLRLEPQEIGSIYPSHGEDRVLVRLDNIPPLLGEALIAVEDKDFAHHLGISFKGIARAMWVNIKAQRFVQGGSTLTQQLVKNFYLTQDRKLWRKIKEAMMAPLLELHYSKAEILEAYINEVYLGQSGARGIHGFGLAATHYFNRPLDKLEPQQVAMLVAMVKGASYYNPLRYPERVMNRRNTVLQLMADNALITEAQRSRYSRLPLGVVKSSAARLGDYPAFLDIVKRQLRRDYRQEDLQSEGLRIFTTLSPNVQALTESAVEKRVGQMNKAATKASGKAKAANNLQAAAMVTAVGSGEIVAMVGGRNPRYSGFNRALDMQRSIGSLVKPFVYLAALTEPQRYTLAQPLDDSPVSIPLDNGELWQPKNYNQQSHGNVPLYQALAFSYNQSTARLGMDIGLDKVIKTLKAAGLEKSVPPLPSLLLGSIDLSPLEVSHLYHTLAADGVYTPLRAIRDVLDSDHQPLQRYPLESDPRLSESLSYLMHYNLQAVMRVGTGRRAYQQLSSDLTVAGKTGTSNQQRDSWFAGYSADHLGVVWVGQDDNKPTSYTGSSGALPIWTDIFSQLSTHGISHHQPDNVEYYWIDSNNGLLSAENCTNAVLIPFIAGSQPTSKTDCEFVDEPITRWFKKWFGG